MYTYKLDASEHGAECDGQHDPHCERVLRVRKDLDVDAVPHIIPTSAEHLDAERVACARIHHTRCVRVGELQRVPGTTTEYLI